MSFSVSSKQKKGLLTLLGVAGVAYNASKIKDNVKRNLAHVDPKQHYTRVETRGKLGIIPRVVYHSTQAKLLADKRNTFI